MSRTQTIFVWLPAYSTSTSQPAAGTQQETSLRQSMNQRQHPLLLTGIKVVDLTSIIFGPYADLPAYDDVIQAA